MSSFDLFTPDSFLYSSSSSQDSSIGFSVTDIQGQYPLGVNVPSCRPNYYPWCLFPPTEEGRLSATQGTGDQNSDLPSLLAFSVPEAVQGSSMAEHEISDIPESFSSKADSVICPSDISTPDSADADQLYPSKKPRTAETLVVSNCAVCQKVETPTTPTFCPENEVCEPPEMTSEYSQPAKRFLVNPPFDKQERYECDMCKAWSKHDFSKNHHCPGKVKYFCPICDQAISSSSGSSSEKTRTDPFFCPSARAKHLRRQHPDFITVRERKSACKRPRSSKDWLLTNGKNNRKRN